MADDEEDDTPPGDEDSELYQPTAFRRTAKLPFLWFVTRNRKNDYVLPLADIRRMEPPDGRDGREAFIHFSGLTVRMEGTGLRRVINRIVQLGCTSVHEYRPGQQKKAGEPVIEKMEFWAPKERDTGPETTH
jgi:hypothetical protein